MEQLLEKWNKYLLNEGGLSRVYDHIMEHDSAILTAFRNEYSNEDNFKRNRELKARLMTAGYGVTKMDGSYIENFETPRAIEVSERSLFASNRKDDPGFLDNITDLSEEYEQDSVLLIPKGGKSAYLVGTREDNEFPPYGDQITVGYLKMGKEDEFMSKTKGRPFTFKEELETYESLTKNSRWAVKTLAERAKNESNES